MSGYNANFRNLGTGSGNNFDGSANFYGSGNVNPSSPVLQPFLTFECGNTTDSFISTSSAKSFFRTGDLISNQAYFARQGTLEIDTAGPVDITVTAVGFAPFVALVRNNGWAKYSVDGSGVLTATIPSDQTGPFTLEISSINSYQTGSFSVQISCTTASGIVLTSSDSIFKVGRNITLTATATPASLGTAHNAIFWAKEGVGAPQLLGVVAFDGSGVAVLHTSAMIAGLRSTWVQVSTSLLLSNTLVLTVYTINVNVSPSFGASHMIYGHGSVNYVSNVFANTTPVTGSVTFTDDLGTLGTATLVAGVATLAVTGQTPYNRVVTAQYNSGDMGTVTLNVIVVLDIQLDSATVSQMNTYEVALGSPGGYSGFLAYDGAGAWNEAAAGNAPSYGLSISVGRSPTMILFATDQFGPASFVEFFSDTVTSFPIGLWSSIGHIPSGSTPYPGWPAPSTVTTTWA